MSNLSFLKLNGVLPVIPTPFHPNGDIDEKGLRSIVDFAIHHRAVREPTLEAEKGYQTQIQRMVDCYSKNS